MVEGGGLTVSGELFTFTSEISKCQVEIDKKLKTPETGDATN